MKRNLSFLKGMLVVLAICLMLPNCDEKPQNQPEDSKKTEEQATAGDYKVYEIYAEYWEMLAIFDDGVGLIFRQTDDSEYGEMGLTGVLTEEYWNELKHYGDVENADQIFVQTDRSKIKNIVIPDVLKGYDYVITSIGEDVFSDYDAIVSVKIPETVRTIGEGAFIGCEKLESITIPKSVTSIGERVFGACYDLKSIKVEDGNPMYDSRDNCNAIIETASNALVSGCSKTIIPKGIESIASFAFYQMPYLASVDVPEGVANIGENAFMGSGISSVLLPNSLRSIGAGAFFQCNSLTSVTIPENVAYVGEEAFGECRKLNSVVIKNPNLEFDYDVVFNCSDNLKPENVRFE